MRRHNHPWPLRPAFATAPTAARADIAAITRSKWLRAKRSKRMYNKA